MDGILVDTMPFHYEAMKRAVKEFTYIELDKRTFYLLEGMPIIEMARKILELKGYDTKQTERGRPNPLYQTGEFSEFDARNYTFNEIGDLNYADTVEYENGFIMGGNISVTDDDTLPPQEMIGSKPQTVCLTMVPTADLAQRT